MLGVPFTRDNHFHLPAGKTDISVNCNGKTMGLADFQRLGYESGSKVLPAAGIEQVLQWGRDLLQM